MNFDYTDEQKLLKEQARKLLEARCSPVPVRAVLNDATKAYDQDLWKVVAEQGPRRCGNAWTLRCQGVSSTPAASAAANSSSISFAA